MALVDPHAPNDPHPYTPDPNAPPRTTDPGYAADPALAMMWGMSAPNVDGNIQGASSSGSGGGTANPHGPISVDMGSFVAAEDAMLPITSSLVQGYNNLRQTVLNTLNTKGFFGEEAMYSYRALKFDSHPDPHNYNNGVPLSGPNAGAVTLTAPDTNVQNMANQFDQVINPLMSRCLRQTADSITALGYFINVINLIAQMNCAADKASYFPPPGTV